MGRSGGRAVAVAETMTVPATKVRRGRKKLYKATVSSPLLDSPDTVSPERFTVARGGLGGAWLGVNVRHAVCVSGFCRAIGGKGEWSPHHKETAQVQDMQEVTSWPQQLEEKDDIRSGLFVLSGEEFEFWICTVFLFYFFPSHLWRINCLWQHTSSEFLSWQSSGSNAINTPRGKRGKIFISKFTQLIALTLCVFPLWFVVIAALTRHR